MLEALDSLERLAAGIILSVVIIQITKFIVYWAYEQKLDILRLFDTGGMPSSHTGAVIALSLGVFMAEGFSALFIVTAVLSAIVVRDAMGMRFEIGKQAKIINMILRDYKSKKRLVHKELRELIGHTPLQVMVGGLMGAAISYIIFSL